MLREVNNHWFFNLTSHILLIPPQGSPHAGSCNVSVYIMYADYRGVQAWIELAHWNWYWIVKFHWGLQFYSIPDFDTLIRSNSILQVQVQNSGIIQLNSKFNALYAVVLDLYSQF